MGKIPQRSTARWLVWSVFVKQQGCASCTSTIPHIVFACCWVNPRQNDKSRARSCRRFNSNLDSVLRKRIKSYVPSPRFVALSFFELLSLKNHFFHYAARQKIGLLFLFRVTISPSKVNTNFLFMKM